MLLPAGDNPKRRGVGDGDITPFHIQSQLVSVIKADLRQTEAYEPAMARLEKSQTSCVLAHVLLTWVGRDLESHLLEIPNHTFSPKNARLVSVRVNELLSAMVLTPGA